MAAIELVFVDRRASDNPPTHLVFGVTGQFSIDRTVSIAVQLPGMTASAILEIVNTISCAAQLPGMTASIIGTTDDSVVVYGITNEWTVPYTLPHYLEATTICPLSWSVRISYQDRVIWDYNQNYMSGYISGVITHLDKLESDAEMIPWGYLVNYIQSDFKSPWTHLDSVSAYTVGNYLQLLDYLVTGYTVCYVYLPEVYSEYSLCNKTPEFISRSWYMNAMSGTRISTVNRVVWRYGDHLFDGVDPRISEPPVIRPPLSLPAQMVLRCPLNNNTRPLPAQLVWGVTCTGSTDRILATQGVYMINNTVSLVKLPGLEVIECTGFTLSSNRDEWGWTLLASIDPVAASLLLPTQGEIIEIQLTVNTTEVFKFIVKNISKSRSFGKASVSVSAVSRTAWLAAPFAPSKERLNTSDLNAHQLIDNALGELSYNDTANYITSSFTLIDWLLPAKSYSHTGTAMEYISDIASSVGGTIQSHRTNLEVFVKPTLPVQGWFLQTSAVDVTLSVAGITTDSYAWTDNPYYNAVTLIGGDIGGVITLAKRAGTAGNALMPAVNHQAFTHIDAARQRAVHDLSRATRVINTTITIPIYETVRIIDPASVVGIIEDSTTVKWVSTGVTISANLPKIEQSVTLERFEYPI